MLSRLWFANIPFYSTLEIYILTRMVSVFLFLGLITENSIQTNHIDYYNIQFFTGWQTHHIGSIIGGHQDIMLLLSMVFIAVIITFKIYWLIKINYELI